MRLVEISKKGRGFTNNVYISIPKITAFHVEGIQHKPYSGEVTGLLITGETLQAAPQNTC